MTIDLEDGKIYEISKSFVGLLKASGIMHYKTILQLDLNERRRTLSDLLVDFQINKLDKYRY